MAVRFDDPGDRISCTGSLPDPAAGITITAWVYVSVDTDSFATIARLWDAAKGTVGTFATNGDGLGGPGYFTGGGSAVATLGLAVGEWRRVAVTCNGTDAAVYAATANGSTQSATGTVAGVPNPTGITLGGRDTGTATETLNGRLAHVRLWSRPLDQTAIEAEWASPTPVATTGLWADWPLPAATDLTDHSGNGHHLTAGTTPVTTEDGPPLPETATYRAAADPRITIATSNTTLTVAAGDTTMHVRGSTEMKVGDLEPALTIVAEDADGTADLNGVQSWRIIGKMGDRGVIDSEPDTVTINSATTATLTRKWQAGETDTEGEMLLEVKATWPGSRTQTFPATTYGKVRFKASLR